MTGLPARCRRFRDLSSAHWYNFRLGIRLWVKKHFIRPYLKAAADRGWQTRRAR